MTFLAENGFDFNKLFKLGIPYLTKADEEKLEEKMIERHKARDDNNQDLIPIPENDKIQVKDIWYNTSCSTHILTWQVFYFYSISKHKYRRFSRIRRRGADDR